MKILEEMKHNISRGVEPAGKGYSRAHIAYVYELQDTAREWIKHFMEKFDIKPEELPTNVHMEMYKESEGSVLSYKLNIKYDKWEKGARDVNAIIAWIKYYFGIKDGEELDDR